MKTALTKTILAAALALLPFGGTAVANTITPDFISVTNIGGGISEWNYSAIIVNSRLQNGDFFTINDFGNVSSVVNVPVGWTFSFALSGPNGDPGATLNPLDSATINNVTFRYTGATVDVANSTTVNFILRSLTGVTTKIGSWSSQDHLFGGAGPDAQGAHGNVEVPNAPAVPEGGSTVALLGLGLVGLLGLRRKFRI